MEHENPTRADGSRGEDNAERKGRYADLWILAGLLRAFGILFVIAGALGFMYGLVALFGERPGMGLAICLSSLVWAGLAAVTHLTTASLTQLLVNVACDTRRSVELLEDVVSALRSLNT